MPLRIVFFGSDDFAAIHLLHLLDSQHEVVGCVTGPDKPQGRGLKLTVSPVKDIAIDRELSCLQPASLKEHGTVEALKSYKADVFVVVAYGKLLTQTVLDVPAKLCLNVHGSLLPKYRGAAPVNWAILNGDKETGVTVQKMLLELDAGDIVAQERMTIADDEDAGQLRKRMADVGAKLLVKVLDDGKFSLKPQDGTQVSWAPKLTKEMGQINWNKPARVIINQIRGLQPWPGTYTFYKAKTLKVLQAQASDDKSGTAAPGQVVRLGKEGFHVACSDGAVFVKEVQPEAGKIMPASSFAAGYRIAVGSML